MPWRAASLASIASSPSAISTPVGLQGELMIMPRVRAVTAARMLSERIGKAVFAVRSVRKQASHPRA